MNYWAKAGIRAGRTFLQTFLGVYTAGLMASQVIIFSDFANVGLLQQGSAAGFVALLSFAQNLLEDTKSLNIPKG